MGLDLLCVNAFFFLLLLLFFIFFYFFFYFLFFFFFFFFFLLLLFFIFFFFFFFFLFLFLLLNFLHYLIDSFLFSQIKAAQEANPQLNVVLTHSVYVREGRDSIQRWIYFGSC
jgi:hypothetical protein